MREVGSLSLLVLCLCLCLWLVLVLPVILYCWQPLDESDWLSNDLRLESQSQTPAAAYSTMAGHENPLLGVSGLREEWDMSVCGRGRWRW